MYSRDVYFVGLIDHGTSGFPEHTIVGALKQIADRVFCGNFTLFMWLGCMKLAHRLWSVVTCSMINSPNHKVNAVLDGEGGGV